MTETRQTVHLPTPLSCTNWPPAGDSFCLRPAVPANKLHAIIPLTVYPLFPSQTHSPCSFASSSWDQSQRNVHSNPCVGFVSLWAPKTRNHSPLSPPPVGLQCALLLLWPGSLPGFRMICPLGKSPSCGSPSLLCDSLHLPWERVRFLTHSWPAGLVTFLFCQFFDLNRLHAPIPFPPRLVII